MPIDEEGQKCADLEIALNRWVRYFGALLVWMASFGFARVGTAADIPKPCCTSHLNLPCIKYGC